MTRERIVELINQIIDESDSVKKKGLMDGLRRTLEEDELHELRQALEEDESASESARKTT